VSEVKNRHQRIKRKKEEQKKNPSNCKRQV